MKKYILDPKEIHKKNTPKKTSFFSKLNLFKKKQVVTFEEEDKRIKNIKVVLKEVEQYKKRLEEGIMAKKTEEPDFQEENKQLKQELENLKKQTEEPNTEKTEEPKKELTIEDIILDTNYKVNVIFNLIQLVTKAMGENERERNKDKLEEDKN